MCAIYRTRLCCYGELIRSDQFIYLVHRNVMVEIFKLFWLLNIAFTKANSAGPDEMLHFAASHLGLHCLLMSNL